MCRILLISGKIPLSDLSCALLEFQKLAERGNIPRGSKKGHKDGWGLVAYSGNRICKYKRSKQDAFVDSGYSETIGELKDEKNDIVICHLRKAAVGSVSVQNSQPFVWQNLSFCHNGVVLGDNRIPLNAKFKKIIKGRTDSEKLFACILQHLPATKNASPLKTEVAIKKALCAVRESFDYTAMNIVFSGGKYSWVLRDVNEKNDEVKKKKMIGYYSLFIGTGKGYVIFSSEKLPIENIRWRAMKNREMLRIK
jgi:predicted glutamine amidotransferase